ncbi:MAG TPA: tRNA lysidine(34) synthetase TilS [Candidatus Saccharimonadales bacterium]|nr:tRNA lysidine(34) synthetase TilS [Candidatus Saccharimonadales bacterium]
MLVNIPRGKYILAVSGGVDSAVLLDILAKMSDIDLIVAHFNHGIRSDSKEDEDLVRKNAHKYNLPFEIGHGKLGASASEERARDARYKFLEYTRHKHKAQAIITAHHQDDLIETAILNIIRGTGRRGLSAIEGNPRILRPMLSLRKEQVLSYARKNYLSWREDPSNKDQRYLRNYIRLQITPRLNQRERQELLRSLTKVAKTNRFIDHEIAKISHQISSSKVINRISFTSLPTEISKEVLMYFLRQHSIRQFDKRTIERLNVALKTAKPQTQHEVTNDVVFKLSRTEAVLVPAPALNISAKI